MPTESGPSFSDKVAAKTPLEINISVRDRLALLSRKVLDQKGVTKIQDELRALQIRTKDLYRLANKSTISDIQGSIDMRQKRLTALTGTPKDTIERKRLATELSLLREALEKTEFRERIRKKTPAELDTSIADRKRAIVETEKKKQDTGKMRWELSRLRERKMELFERRIEGKTLGQLTDSLAHRHDEIERRREKKQPLDDLVFESYTLKKRKDYLSKFQQRVFKKSRSDLLGSIELRRKSIKEREAKGLDVSGLKVELAMLEARRKELEEVEAGKMRTGKGIPEKTAALGERPVAVAVGAEKAVEEKAPPKKEEVEVGAHGVVLTPLVREGAVVDGKRLKQGDDRERIASLKSRQQYENKFRNLFTDTGSLVRDEHPKVKEAKAKRRKLLRAVGLAYISRARVRAESLSGVSDAQYSEAMAYLRYTVEQKVGSALIPETELPNQSTHLRVIGQLLKAIPEDNISADYGLRQLLINGLPNGRTDDMKQLDTLQLGLMLEQLDTNAAAQKEHKINELVQRFGL